MHNRIISTLFSFKLVAFGGVILLAFDLSAQEQILKDFDFENGDYRVFFFYQENSCASVDSLWCNPFVVHDQQKLKALQNNWVATNEVEGLLWCGYDYLVYVVLGDTIISKLSVNTRHGQVIVKGVGTSYDFKPHNPFIDLEADGLVYDTVLRADTITKARNLYQQIIDVERIYYPEAHKQEYLKYDGRFYFRLYIGEQVKLGLVHATGSGIELPELKRLIYELYPNKSYDIHFWGFSPSTDGYIDGYILGDTSLFELMVGNPPSWENYYIKIPEHSKYEYWHQISSKARFGAYLFTDDKAALKQLIDRVEANQN